MMKYASPRLWLRALAKTAIHDGTNALLAFLGTNGLASAVPALSDLALNLKQMGVVFAISALVSAIKFINKTTEDTTPPVPQP
jgi:hypothetical protein